MKNNSAIFETLSRAVAVHRAGQLSDAASLYQTVLNSDPKNADALRLLGTIHHQLGNYKEAIALIQRSLKVYPHQPDALNNLGNAFNRLKLYDEALANFDKAIALKPDYAEAYYNRGLSLKHSGQYEEAIRSLDRAIAIDPNHSDAYGVRGNILQYKKHNSEALASYDKAISLKPAHAEFHYNRGVALEDMKRYDQALASYDTAIALNPDATNLMGAYVHTKMMLSDWRDINAAFDRLTKAVEAGKLASTPFVLLAIPSSPSQQRKCAESFVKNNCPQIIPGMWNGERYSHERIRIGYFSADLNERHPLASLMAEFFELHDRTKFEVTAFSFEQSANDPMRTRLEKAFEHFIDVSTKTDREIAALARKMEIDIAVNLGGFTGGSRTGIFAMRPAPVQISYMGYPGTMGASYIDYLVADVIVLPEEHKEFYAEKIVHLPHSYWVIDSTKKVIEKSFTRKEMGLPENGFVFCCFNNNYKITPDVFDIWMRLLDKVEGSVLWLLEVNTTAVKNLRAEAEARGISGDRLVFAKRMDRDDHLARQRLADLFIDTFYYNAHTTTSDALWAGLPVITCLGNAFAGRVAASLLYAANMPELITHSHKEYESLALELATNPKKLSALRQKLVQNRTTCPLFNTKLFTKCFEGSYIEMLERSHSGSPPDHIHIAI